MKTAGEVLNRANRAVAVIVAAGTPKNGANTDTLRP